jgi:hypothetical protein
MFRKRMDNCASAIGFWWRACPTTWIRADRNQRARQDRINRLTG